MGTLQILATFALVLNPASSAEVEISEFRAPNGPISTDIRSLHVAANGTLWVGSRGGGLSRLDNTGWSSISRQDLGMDSVAAIFSSPDGTLWFGGPGGVTRFDGETWSRYDEQLGRPVRIVFNGFAESDGTVWLATNVGAVSFDGADWKWTSSENGLKHDVVHQVHRDRSGDLWFATRRGGLSRLSSSGVWEHLFPEDNIRAILEDRQRRLWFGTSSGVHCLDSGRWTSHHPTESVLPLFGDSRGNLWFSRADGGALRFRNGDWTVQSENVPSDEIHAMAESGDRSLWFGSSDGLRRLRKRAKTQISP